MSRRVGYARTTAEMEAAKAAGLRLGPWCPKRQAYPTMHGSKHGRDPKLTSEQHEEIKAVHREYMALRKRFAGLSAEFRVSSTTINKICQGRQYANLRPATADEERPTQ